MSSRPRDDDSDEDRSSDELASTYLSMRSVSDVVDSIIGAVRAPNSKWKIVVDDFVIKNCHRVEQTKGEHSLVNTSLHETFKGLYENQLEALIQSEGSNETDFYQYIRLNENCSAAHFGRILLASFDFDSFMILMFEAKHRIPQQSVL